MLGEFAERVGNLNDPGAFQQFITEELSALGLEYFAYLSFGASCPRKTARVISNYPLDWVRRYIALDYYKSDPVLTSTPYNLEPFDWAIFRERRIMPLEQARIMHEAREFGLCEGICVPIHTQDGLAMLSVASSAPRREFEDLVRRQKLHLHGMALYYHAALAKNIDGHRPLKVELTDRERDVLRYSEEVSSLWEISEKIGLPHAHVRRYMHAAMKKLGASSPRQALSEAICNQVL